MKQLILSDVQRFGLSTPWLCLMNCRNPLLTLNTAPSNSTIVLLMWLSISYNWNGGVADESEVRKHQRQAAECTIEMLAGRWYSLGVVHSGSLVNS